MIGPSYPPWWIDEHGRTHFAGAIPATWTDEDERRREIGDECADDARRYPDRDFDNDEEGT